MAEAQDASEVPLVYALHPNAPNPFNPVTTIAYDLPEAARVRLTIHNAVGQQVATLVSRTQEPGRYAVPLDRAGFASGLYLYRLQAGSFSQTRRMVLLR